MDLPITHTATATLSSSAPSFIQNSSQSPQMASSGHGNEQEDCEFGHVDSSETLEHIKRLKLMAEKFQTTLENLTITRQCEAQNSKRAQNAVETMSSRYQVLLDISEKLEMIKSAKRDCEIAEKSELEEGEGDKEEVESTSGVEVEDDNFSTQVEPPSDIHSMAGSLTMPAMDDFYENEADVDNKDEADIDRVQKNIQQSEKYEYDNDETNEELRFSNGLVISADQLNNASTEELEKIQRYMQMEKESLQMKSMESTIYSLKSKAKDLQNQKLFLRDNLDTQDDVTNLEEINSMMDEMHTQLKVMAKMQSRLKASSLNHQDDMIDEFEEEVVEAVIDEKQVGKGIEETEDLISRLQAASVPDVNLVAAAANIALAIQRESEPGIKISFPRQAAQEEDSKLEDSKGSDIDAMSEDELVNHVLKQRNVIEMLSMQRAHLLTTSDDPTAVTPMTDSERLSKLLATIDDDDRIAEEEEEDDVQYEKIAKQDVVAFPILMSGQNEPKHQAEHEAFSMSAELMQLSQDGNWRQALEILTKDAAQLQSQAMTAQTPEQQQHYAALFYDLTQKLEELQSVQTTLDYYNNVLEQHKDLASDYKNALAELEGNNDDDDVDEGGFVDSDISDYVEESRAFEQEQQATDGEQKPEPEQDEEPAIQEIQLAEASVSAKVAETEAVANARSGILSIAAEFATNLPAQDRTMFLKDVFDRFDSGGYQEYVKKYAEEQGEEASDNEAWTEPAQYNEYDEFEDAEEDEFDEYEDDDEFEGAAEDDEEVSEGLYAQDLSVEERADIKSQAEEEGGNPHLRRLFNDNISSVYALAADTISLNEEEPYFLLRLFGGLKELDNSYLRQKMLMFLDGMMEEKKQMETENPVCDVKAKDAAPPVIAKANTPSINTTNSKSHHTAEMKNSPKSVRFIVEDILRNMPGPDLVGDVLPAPEDFVNFKTNWVAQG